MTESDLQRFNAKVEKDEETGYWTWIGSTNEHGYGSFHIQGRRIQAHRVAFEHWVGNLDSDECCHKCDNPACVNPNHLFRGSHQANMIDSAIKDRNGAIKITKERLVELIERHKKGESRKVLADSFGVSGATISHIISGSQRGILGLVETWKRIRKCSVCGSEFMPKMPWQDRCTRKCTNRHWTDIERRDRALRHAKSLGL